MKVTRHKVKNGYQYKVDGSVHIYGTRTLYTWAATYEVGSSKKKTVTLHKDAGAARAAQGHAGSGWVKTGTVEIKDA